MYKMLRFPSQSSDGFMAASRCLFFWIGVLCVISKQNNNNFGVVNGLVAPVTYNAGGGGTSSSNNNDSNNNNSGDQLHWPELAQILLNMNDAGVPDEVLMRTRVAITNLNRVRIGPSQIPNAGRGLFATVDCHEGDLLSCYPGDVLLQPTGMTGLPPYLQAEENDATLRSLLAKYSIGITDGYAIMALPELDQDMAYASHFINDGARPPEREDDLERYLEESRNLANAYHIPLENLHMVTVAKRDIKKGEEILACYGPIYWMGHTETWKGDELVLP